VLPESVSFYASITHDAKNGVFDVNTWAKTQDKDRKKPVRIIFETTGCERLSEIRESIKYDLE